MSKKIKVERGLAEQLRGWPAERKRDLKRAIADIDWDLSATKMGAGVEAASADGFFFVFRRPAWPGRGEIRLLDIKQTDELDKLSA